MSNSYLFSLWADLLRPSEQLFVLHRAATLLRPFRQTFCIILYLPRKSKDNPTSYLNCTSGLSPATPPAVRLIFTYVLTLRCMLPIRLAILIQPQQNDHAFTRRGGSKNAAVLSVHVNKAFRFEKIDLELQKEVSGKIVDDIFRHAGLAKDDAPECWEKSQDRLVKGKLLNTTLSTRITAYSGWKTIKQYSKTAMRLYQQTGKLPCLPAHVMISMIALLFYRKIRLDTASMKKSSPNVLELFGAHDTTKWLRVAILTSEQVGHESFLVEVDHEMVAPQVRKEHSGSDNFSIVTTTEPPISIEALSILAFDTLKSNSEDESHRESTASTDTDDSPIEQVVTRSITRVQALERAGDLINQVRNPDFDQFALKDKMGLWLSEPVIRVLPMGLRKTVLLYCSDHLPDWSVKIKEHYFEDRDEHTWQETIQVAPAEQVYGKETLGSLLAKLKTIEANIHPTELREATLDRDLATFARKKETFAEEMSQQRQTLDWDLEVFARQRQALEDTSDLETLWGWFQSAEVNIPDVLRIVMHARCSWDTLQRLSDLDNVQN
ncbi:uncharacterized protein NECHADRAFT_75812 [Fusarium vanettenii 77-13-4]|uniref:Uncharacterized protein n=1 Tax=Fusarium vanettenii (strain ATCC MYA-4622 / CBS 123669 / FGSC 9596 / NRRL 45880 / 77-13-4) TaxID=660122 RepID=C7Z5N4_FUSV7|nr:uncharacterized protein NECHADRAFT_75812 [Fusarium vanettenii 77-13-4]EEU40555.1 hypothetical protein NECHADRAFT_75812 [Fusarium vanettenii 77-13-4]